MKIFGRFHRKRQQPDPSDDFVVTLVAGRLLSKEEVDTIITIVRKGIIKKDSPFDIGIDIMLSTGIYDSIVITRDADGVKVFF